MRRFSGTPTHSDQIAARSVGRPYRAYLAGRANNKIRQEKETIG